MQTIRHYFPGGNTPLGFFNNYGEILDKTSVGHLAVIKGGPGTGKSTFMKQLGEALEQAGESVSYLHCSSDPYSLDGLFLKRYNSAIVDGTAPHVTDPRYPGSADILLNFCDAIREEEMAGQGETLQQLNEEISRNFKTGYCYLNAAASVGKLMQQKSSLYLAEEEINRFTADFLKRLSGYPAEGTKKTMFLSAITPYGCRNYLKEDLNGYFVVMLQADTGDVASRILTNLANACRLRQVDMELYTCPMNPTEPEHLVFPSANLAITVANGYHTYDNPDEVIYFSDFCRGEYDNAAERTRYRNLLQAAVSEFAKAKALHDRLERLYIPNVDFSHMEKLKTRALNFLTQTR